MARGIEEQLRVRNAAVAEQDDELAAEMVEVREAARPADVDGRPGRVTLEGAVAERATTSFEQETIVLRTGRPVLAVRHGTAQLEFTAADSKIWKARLRQAKAALAPAVHAVGRVELKNNPRFDWVGTAWLVADDVLVTNRHVAQEFARANGDGFDFRVGPDGPMEASIDFLREFGSNERRSMKIERVLHIEDETGPDVALLKLAGSGATVGGRVTLATGSVTKKQFIAAIGYPARDSRIPDQALMERIFGNVYDVKRFAPGQVIGTEDGALLHDCSTLGGNSGSAVVDLTTGHAVGLHFAGRFLEANFAVPSDVLADLLRRATEGRPRPRPKPISPSSAGISVSARPASSDDDQAAPGRSTTLSYTIPVELTVRIGVPTTPAAATPSSDGSRRVVHRVDDQDALGFEAPRSTASYADRKGYDADFLGDGMSVPLPKVGASQQRNVLSYELDGARMQELPYRHFSVVMNKKRRLCFFSAANIDGRRSRPIKRVGWRFDPRIPTELQILKECYGNEPKFARGHMTRREDPVWGTEKESAQGNEDSMHATNVVPQMQPFNAGIWLGLENYALRHARQDKMRISVFTGPFFTNGDPERDGVKIPLSFWKVIAFVHDETGELCATGYTMSQKDFLSEEEFVFGQHETAQIPIATIETRAGLSFGKLASLDPLAGEEEEAVTTALTSLDQIRFV